MAEIYNFTSINIISDKYGGITLDSSSIPDDVNIFEKELINITENIKDKKLLWVNIPIEKSRIIPLLTKYKFVFHHCNERNITMIKTLIHDATIPTATNHTIGVGAAIIDGNKLLVVKDRIWKKFRLPGGYIDDNESISQALQREVFEETGIKTEFASIVSSGHFSKSQFENSNLYIVCRAKALSKEININDPHEIIEAKWMDLDEYFNNDDIHIYNKKIVRAAIENRGLVLENHKYFADDDEQEEYYF